MSVVNLKEKPDHNSLDSISVFLFSKSPLVYKKKFSRTSTIHPGISFGRALWADIVSLSLFQALGR